MNKNFSSLSHQVICCKRCPRLVQHRETVFSGTSFCDEPHWRKPVPGFGDEKAWLLILGLAPSPKGGNRTGRIFTGDASGRFLFPLLYEAGFANQPHSESLDDGLTLKGCYITALVKCVPPKHKPLQREALNCREYLLNELYLLKNLRAILALGRFAFDSLLKIFEKKSSFSHGAKVLLGERLSLYASYHPSPQNTYTKKITPEMFLEILREIQKQTSD